MGMEKILIYIAGNIIMITIWFLIDFIRGERFDLIPILFGMFVGNIIYALLF